MVWAFTRGSTQVNGLLELIIDLFLQVWFVHQDREKLLEQLAYKNSNGLKTSTPLLLDKQLASMLSIVTLVAESIKEARLGHK